MFQQRAKSYTKSMTRQLTTESVSRMHNGGGGALLHAGDNDAFLDVLTDYFTETIHSEGKLTHYTMTYIYMCIGR